ncbi:MAG TPA: hypothetical protein DC049_16020, partial [Spirochaetia bacterium]|nr:hypothetical protein [Spirochaetia bacterium]
MQIKKNFFVDQKVFKKYLSEKPCKILIIKLSSIGDVIMLTSAIRAIKKFNPQIEIHFIVEAFSYHLLAENHHLGRIFVFRREEWQKRLAHNPFLIFAFFKYLCGLIGQIRRNQYDLAVDYQGLARSVFFLYFCRSRYKSAWGKWPGFSMRYIDDRKTYAPAKYSACTHALGLSGENTDYTPEIIISSEEEKKARDFINTLPGSARGIALINPLSRWKTKNLSVHSFLQLVKVLSALGYMPVLTGTDTAEEYLQA